MSITSCVQEEKETEVPTCTKCKEDKPESGFHMRKDGRLGRRSHCKDCTNARNLSRYHKFGDVKESHNRASRKHLLRVKYGITPEIYEAMFEKQGGVCYICHLPEPHANTSFLCVDHNHKTGEVRKLLCSHCNIAIGRAREDTYILSKMIEYLEEHEEDGTLRDGL